VEQVDEIGETGTVSRASLRSPTEMNNKSKLKNSEPSTRVNTTLKIMVGKETVKFNANGSPSLSGDPAVMK
jgi:hypothetical protein